jgi:hypothetical protein
LIIPTCSQKYLLTWKHSAAWYNFKWNLGINQRRAKLPKDLHMRFSLRIAFVLALLSALACAQITNATITGRVVDPSNSLVTDAKVEAISLNTNIHYSGQTNREGLFTITGVPPGPYRVAASKAGFRTIVREDVVLRVQDIVALNFTLQVGSVSETVTVTGGAPMVDTQSAAVSTVIDQSYVANMPLNGRSFQDLILLTPGVVTQTPQAPGTLGGTGEFSVNGQRTESNYYTVDGVSANIGAASGSYNGYQNTSSSGASGSVPGATALGTTQALTSVDALQEFRVASSTYSAEFGRNPGAQIAFETKSGTQQWHGSAFNYLRNGYFDAQDWFNDYAGLKNGSLHQNDFGGTFGGPVWIPGAYNGKDKTFFFVSYEGLRLNAPVPANPSLYVPDNALRASAPVALQPVMSAYPAPTPDGQDFASSGAAQYLATWANPSSINATSARFDENVSSQLRLFFRFNNTTSSSAARGNSSGNAPSVELISDSTVRTYTAGATSMFSNRLTNDFRLNYSSNVSSANQFISPIGGSAPLDLNQFSGLGPTGEGSVCIVQSISFQCMGLDQGRWSGAQQQWNVVDTVSLTAGSHQFKFGVDYRRLTPNAVVGTPTIGYDYYSSTDVQSNSATLFANQYDSAFPLYKNFAVFADDQWRVSRRVTLDMGLRWEVDPPPSAAKGRTPYTLQGTSVDTLVLQPQGTPLWRTTWFNFAPRLGAAYSITNKDGWQTVARGGVGVFFDTGQQMGSLAFVGPGFSALNVTSGSYPVSASTPGLLLPITDPCQQSACPGPYNTTPYGYSPHLQLPYTLHWNASIEQSLGKWQALTVSYVASRASRLLQTNFLSPTNNPNSSFLVLVQNGLTSDYDAFQTQFQRRLNAGLTALASYTWSHCLDYGSNNTLYGYIRGNCDFDVRHSFSGAVSYNLPGVSSNAVAHAVLSHWGVDTRFMARTAFPVGLVGSGFFGPDEKYHSESLTLVPGQTVYLSGANCASILQAAGELQTGYGCPGGRGFNPNAFTNASSGFGNAPRNFAGLFGAWQMDTAVRREFPINERMKLQFRAEAFNLFNHPNFGTVDEYFGDPKFGLATGTLANALSTESPLYQLGGPRSMQFALKLLF